MLFFGHDIGVFLLRFGRTVRPNVRWKWPNRSGSAEPRFWPFGRSLLKIIFWHQVWQHHIDNENHIATTNSIFCTDFIKWLLVLGLQGESMIVAHFLWEKVSVIYTPSIYWTLTLNQIDCLKMTYNFHKIAFRNIFEMLQALYIYSKHFNFSMWKYQ